MDRAGLVRRIWLGVRSGMNFVRLRGMRWSLGLILIFTLPVWGRTPRCGDVLISYSYQTDHIQAEYRFGAEFTFSNSDLLRGSVEAKKAHYSENGEMLERLKTFYERECLTKGCKVIQGSDKHGPTFKVLHEDNWYFIVSVDYSVIEVQTKASSYSDFVNHKDLIRREIFENLKKFNLKPHATYGGGHIHIDLKAFGNNAMLFRNFIVDFANNPLVTYGVLGKDLNNAPPLIALKRDQVQAFQDLLEIFDDNQTMSIKTFAAALDRDVYTETYNSEESWQKHHTHYQALRVNRINDPFIEFDDKTVEVRGVRPQKDVEAYLLQIELFLARIEYLKSVSNPILFRDQPFRDFTDQEMVDSFYTYVVDAGLQWSRFKHLLPSELKSVEPTRIREQLLDDKEKMRFPFLEAARKLLFGL